MSAQLLVGQDVITPPNSRPAPTTPAPTAPAAPPAFPHHRRRWLKPAIWSAWLLLPLAGLAYHVGAGEPHIQRDDANELVRAADAILARDTTVDPTTGSVLDRKGRQEAKAKMHTDAAGKLAAARAALPDRDSTMKLDLRLLETQHRIDAGEWLESQAVLQGLLGEYEAFGRNASRIDEIRNDLGRISYYIAFAMRKEGAPEEDWRPESDIARQQFRHLAEVIGGEKLEEYKRDLETVIRFQRLTGDEVQDEDQPGNGSGKKMGKKGKQKYSKGKSQGEGDAREKIKSDAASAAQRGGKGS